MNHRRRLVIALGSAVSIPRAVFAQAKKPPVVIGWLHGTGPSTSQLAAFKDGMAALQYKEGTSYVVEARWAEGRLERLLTLAEDLKQRKPAVIVTFLTAATEAALRAFPETPIVQAVGASPVDLGHAKSLGRPSGMVTGLTNIAPELSVKYLELLLAAVPRLKRVGFLMDSTSPFHDRYLENTRRGLEHFGVQGRFAEVAKPEDVNVSVTRLANEGIQGLVVMPSNWLAGERFSITKLALTHRLPVVAGPQAFTAAGALLSYSADALTLCRRAAYFVDRILKGAKPGDLPIEQPTTFELVVNMKTAKALGLTMSPEIMVQATRVMH